eukprot:COSAG05_NODE_461_length_9571_cov_14.935283_4_plen_101_part_00
MPPEAQQRSRASEAAKRWKEEQAREEASMLLSGRIWKAMATINVVWQPAHRPRPANACCPWCEKAAYPNYACALALFATPSRRAVRRWFALCSAFSKLGE